MKKSFTENKKIFYQAQVASVPLCSIYCVISEDKTFLRICLPKVLTTADQCWTSLLDGQFQPDPHTLDEMQKKLTLQRYQFEVITDLRCSYQ